MFRTVIASLLVLDNSYAAASSTRYKDALEVPALKSSAAARSPITGIVRAGDRLVAVGVRGHILLSADGGMSWTQGDVPVSVDLTAVYFPGPDQGWAVGHEGVVLHTGDGGRTWEKQLDGREAAALIRGTYERGAGAGDAAAARVLDEARRLAAEGADKPLLDVWFADERTGFVVGAFNLVLGTTDGGKTWEPWIDRIENPSGFHLYSIRGSRGEVFIAGEQGLILRLDMAVRRFVAVSSPYRGTYFGVLVKDGIVVVFGLRGNAYASSDLGRTWRKIPTGIETGIQGGAVLADGRILLASQGGQVLVSADDARTFSAVKLSAPAPFAAVADAGSSAIALGGHLGLRVEHLQ